jgi:hypothetical protein
MYGTRAPLRSWNPLWANAEVYWAMATDAWHARRWRDKLRVWIARPGWRPADVAERFPKPDFDRQREEYDPPVSRTMAVYCLVQFALLLGFGVQFLQTAMLMSLSAVVAYLVFLVGSLVLLGALLEGRRLAPWFEVARLVLFGVVPTVSGLWLDGGELPSVMRWVCALAAAISFAMLMLAWRGYSAMRRDGSAAVAGDAGQS